MHVCEQVYKCVVLSGTLCQWRRRRCRRRGGGGGAVTMRACVYSLHIYYVSASLCVNVCVLASFLAVLWLLAVLQGGREAQQRADSFSKVKEELFISPQSLSSFFSFSTCPFSTGALASWSVSKNETLQPSTSLAFFFPFSLSMQYISFRLFSQPTLTRFLPSHLPVLEPNAERLPETFRSLEVKVTMPLQANRHLLNSFTQ